MQNSKVLFTVSVLHWKYPFLGNLVQKIKIVSLKEKRNCVLRIIVFRHYFVQYGLRHVCIIYLTFWKTTFLSFCIFTPVFASVFPACSAFSFYLHEYNNIYAINVYIGVRYFVTLFSLYKKEFTKTNISTYENLIISLNNDS